MTILNGVYDVSSKKIPGDTWNNRSSDVCHQNVGITGFQKQSPVGTCSETFKELENIDFEFDDSTFT